jgi:hypothetical protein
MRAVDQRVDQYQRVSPGSPLDMTHLVQRDGNNVVTLETLDPRVHCVAILVVRDVPAKHVADAVLRLRGVSLPVATACVLASFVPGGGSFGTSVLKMQAAAAAGLLDTARISGGGGNADDDDVETTSTLLNLKDVVSWAPVRVPVRGVACDHLQCCDLVSYLLLHQRPSLKRWLCPVCNKVRVLACVRGTPVAFPFMAVQVVEHSHRATHTHTHAPPLTLNSSPSHCLLCAALPCAAAADTLSLRRLLHA